MQFTFVDGAVALIVILSGVLAYSRGLTREIFAIGGWIVAAIAAFYFTPTVEPLMREIPAIGEFLASSCVISTIAAFTLIVGLCLLVLSVFTPLFSTMMLDSAFGVVDKILGFFFGIARGILLIAVAFLIFTNLSAEETIPQLENSATRPLMQESAAVLEQNLPDSVPAWFSERIDALMGPCAGATPAGPVVEEEPAAEPEAAPQDNTQGGTGN